MLRGVIRVLTRVDSSSEALCRQLRFCSCVDHNDDDDDDELFEFDECKVRGAESWGGDGRGARLLIENRFRGANREAQNVKCEKRTVKHEVSEARSANREALATKGKGKL